MKKILLIGVAVLVALVVLAGVLAITFLNSLVKKGVETAGPIVTKVELRLASADISILSGKGTLRGLFIGNPTGYKTASAIEVGEATLALKPSSLLSDKIVVRQVNVVAPEITFEGSLKGSNLSKILENIQAFTASEQAAKSGDKGKAKKLQVDDFAVTDGKIHLSATLLGGKALTVPLPDIHLAGLGQGPEGVTHGELIEKVFKEVLEGTLKAVGHALANVGKEAVETAKDVGKGAVKQAEKVGKGITDLFKKKK